MNSLKECSGCGACMNICPRNAISMFANEEGFLYPMIDNEKCIDCMLCKKVCQMFAENKRDVFIQQYYGVINNDEKQLKESSSGGAFLAVVDYIFQNGGVVVGCAFDDELRAHHIIVDDMQACIDKLCGSKYVQSDTQNIYIEVKKQLLSGRLVLFSGTPCQIEGLYFYLQGRPENLFTIDLICHGVSSPLLWKKHKDYLEGQVHSKINKYRFRGKGKGGWTCGYYYYYGEQNKLKEGTAALDHYYSDFVQALNYRESCYSCKFANLNRVGDLTIGDFWGVQNYFPAIDKEKGVSLLIVNSARGERLFQNIKENMIIYETTAEDASSGNHNLLKPAIRPDSRNNYYTDAFRNFGQWEKSFTKTWGWKIAKIKNSMPLGFKRVIKNSLQIFRRY